MLKRQVNQRIARSSNIVLMVSNKSWDVKYLIADNQEARATSRGHARASGPADRIGPIKRAAFGDSMHMRKIQNRFGPVQNNFYLYPSVRIRIYSAGVVKKPQRMI